MKYSFYYRKNRLVPGFVFLEVFLELEQLFPSPSIRPPVFYRQSIVFCHSFGRENSCLEQKSPAFIAFISLAGSWLKSP